MSRFYSMVGEDMAKYKSGLAMLLTTRGIPQIYYGNEVLMKNFSSPDGLVREDFKGGWDGDKQNNFLESGRGSKENEAFNFVKKLANYRKNSEALQTGGLMQYVPEEGIYVYFRYHKNNTVMVIVNSNNKESSISTGRFYERMKGFTKAIDIITETTHNSIDTFSIPAKNVWVLELR
jgi:glycosidase